MGSPAGLTILLFMTVLIPLFGSTFTAATAGTMTGTVINNYNSNLVWNVAISVYRPDSTLAASGTTDGNGKYSLTLNAGEYYAAFSKVNFRDTTISDIIITADDTTIVDLVFAIGSECHFIVGDVNGTGVFNGLDVTYGIQYFEGGMAPIECLCECTPGNIWYVCGDANESCTYNGMDITYLVFVLPGGPPPTPCPDCPPVE